MSPPCPVAHYTFPTTIMNQSQPLLSKVDFLRHSVTSRKAIEKMVPRSEVVAMIKLTLWFRDFWSRFVGKMLKSLEMWPLKLPKCYRQSLMSHYGGNEWDQHTSENGVKKLGTWSFRRQPLLYWDFVLHSCEELRSSLTMFWKLEWGWIQKQLTNRSDRGNFK